MPRYRRARAPGASYFFTVTLHDRKSDLLVREINLLRRCVRASSAAGSPWWRRPRSAGSA